MNEPEMDALLDVLEYDALAGHPSPEAYWWTWERGGQQWVQMELHRVRACLRRWKGLD